MATKIIHKKSSVAASVPAAADIAPGELALNLADQKIYSKQTDGTIVEMAPTVASGYLVKTTAYTAVANDNIIANTSGGVFTITLPASPSAGDTVVIADGAAWATNNLTVARNGSTIEGDAEDMTMDLDGVNANFVYDGTTWQVYAHAGITSNLQAYTETEFTATASQTTFTVDYTAGKVNVHLNGVKLANADYTATNGTTIVLTEAAAVDDILNVVAWNSFTLADTATSAQGALADSALQPTGDTMTGDLSFGDNDKAIFGAGSDLQIYHNGTQSFIEDTGTGSLFLRSGSNIYIQNAGGTANYFKGTDGGASELFHNGSQKLTTTSTGIDVTGTVTADGLTVEGNDSVITTTATTGTQDLLSFARPTYGEVGKISRTSGSLSLQAEQNLTLGADYTNVNTGANSNIFMQTDGIDRLKVASNGDISFYEDTGTTPKFFWDASAESLGIGTSSPASQVHLAGGVNGTLRVDTTASGYLDLSMYSNGGFIATSAAQPLRFGVSNAERMRIDSSGNLLVGKTSLGLGITGSEIRAGGQLLVTADGDNPADFNRKTSDGVIALFRKDGSTVGSIGSQGGATLSIAGAVGSGIYFGSTGVLPANGSGSLVDATRDIGSASWRNKDLYLSGTANAANFNTTSDATLKTNVETLTGSLDAVKALRGVSFDWIDNGGSEVGFLAQEVEEIVPDVVSTNDEGIKSVKYGNMVALLIEAMKEQQAQIDELRAQLNS